MAVKKLLLFVALLISCRLASNAQGGRTSGVLRVTVDPAGACNPFVAPLEYNAVDHTLWGCNSSSVWSQISGGGGGGGGIANLTIQVPSYLAVSPSSLSADGTFVFSSALAQPANSFLGTPDGTTGPAALRRLVSGDIPDNGANTTGTSSNVTSIVALSHGGLGSAYGSLLAAFNALSPLTTTNDLLTFTGGNNVRLATGTAHQLLHGGNTWSLVDLTSDVVGPLPFANMALTFSNIVSLWTSCGSNVMRGDGTCIAPTSGTVTNTVGALTSGQLITGHNANDIQVGNLSGDCLTSGGTLVTCTKINGNAVPAAVANNQTLIANGANNFVFVNWVDCQDVSGNHINYNATTHTISCGTSGGAGSPSLSSISFSQPQAGHATITAQLKLQQYVSIKDFNNAGAVSAVCDGGTTNDSAALSSALATGLPVHIPPGSLCGVDNVTMPANSSIICDGQGAGLIKMSTGTTTSMLLESNNDNIRITGCILDGNSVASTVATTAFLSFTTSLNVTVENNIFRNVGGVTAGNLNYAVYAKTTGLTLRGNNALTGMGGSFLFLDNNLLQRPVHVSNNTLANFQDNAFVIENSSIGVNTVMVEVDHNNVSAIADVNHGSAGTNGNVFYLFQVQRADVHDNYCDSVEISCVFISGGSYNNIHDNHASNIHSSAFFTGVGSYSNTFHDNWISNASSGVVETNASTRAIDLPDVIYNNHCYGVRSWCVQTERGIIHDNDVYNTPVGVRVGNGSTTGGNVVYNNHCRSGDASSFPNDICVMVDTAVNSIYGKEDIHDNNIESNNSSKSPVAVQAVNNIVRNITSITNASPALVTLTPGNPMPSNGWVVCFANVALGMTQINGQCGVVSNVTATTYNVGINTSIFGAWMTPTNGVTEAALYLWTGSSVTTPISPLPSNVFIRNETLTFPYVSTLAVGSMYAVSDGLCNGTNTLTGSGSGAIAFQNPTAIGCISNVITPIFGVNVVTFASSPVFNLTLGSYISMTLTGNVTSSSVTNILAGQMVTVRLCQDVTGGRTFTWPANFHGAMTIGTTANSCSVQTFSAFDTSNFYSSTPGVINQ